ncbi:MAG: glycosyltransferase family 2 protein [Bacteroidales bacterium]|nr:glycosyltransferase family 2 protein [Bacteroidales bacterium]
MLDISVIILTYNEEIHIERCIQNIKTIAKDIFVVDCFSTDNTVKIAKSLGAKVFQHKWENSYAKQFNWALENLPITTKWILRLDADEYLYPELIEEITKKLPKLPENITGIVFKRRHIFLEKWMKRGTYPVKLLRLFQHKKGICEQRWMDEHIQLNEGISIEFEHDFADHNLNNLTWWTQKHNGYAIREAIDLLNIELHFYEEKEPQLNAQALKKRKHKESYARKPLFLRAFIYFVYRYFFKLGFLEGKEGFLWHFLQGWWYRTLVDVKIYEIKKTCGTDKEKIKQYLLTHHHINIDDN